MHRLLQQFFDQKNLHTENQENGDNANTIDDLNQLEMGEVILKYLFLLGFRQCFSRDSCSRFVLFVFGSWYERGRPYHQKGEVYRRVFMAQNELYSEDASVCRVYLGELILQQIVIFLVYVWYLLMLVFMIYYDRVLLYVSYYYYASSFCQRFSCPAGFPRISS